MTRLPKSRVGPDKAAATQSHVSIHGPGEFLTVPDTNVSDQSGELRAVFSPGVRRAGAANNNTPVSSWSVCVDLPDSTYCSQLEYDNRFVGVVVRIRVGLRVREW